MNTRNLVRISVIAALYAVFTIFLAPISYGVLQFRISEFLKVFVLYNPWFSIGIGIGTFFANLASPYVGPLELIWMPLTDIAGGIIAWKIYVVLNKKYPAVPMGIYAFTTASSVTFMLYILGAGAVTFIFFPIFISESIILITAIPIVKYIAHFFDF